MGKKVIAYHSGNNKVVPFTYAEWQQAWESGEPFHIVKLK